MNRRPVVLDASALLCVLFAEAGSERVAAILPTARMSAVNFSEVVAKLIERGAEGPAVLERLGTLDIEVVNFNRPLAERAGLLRKHTREAGLSLGDRACLALAAELDAVAVTTDRAWARLSIDVQTDVVR